MCFGIIGVSLVESWMESLWLYQESGGYAETTIGVLWCIRMVSRKSFAGGEWQGWRGFVGRVVDMLSASELWGRGDLLRWLSEYLPTETLTTVIPSTTRRFPILSLSALLNAIERSTDAMPGSHTRMRKSVEQRRSSPDGFLQMIALFSSLWCWMLPFSLSQQMSALSLDRRCGRRVPYPASTYQHVQSLM